MTRSDGVVALGGGVVGDLAGFAAATYMRGIGFVQVPTTLLAMVDSSIGGKTGVDIPEGKNLVGAFHLPAAIIRDCAFLGTLPGKELMNGYAEMIKTAVLFDPELFETMKRKPVGDDLAAAVERCAALKEAVVADDFRESGRRMLLNLGHTFGHAIEKVSGYAVPHGEAVAMGMRIVGGEVPEIGEILDSYGFGTLESAGLGDAREELLKAMSCDKKRTGDAVTLVVPAAIGDCRLVPVPVAELCKWL
jgi:3-dehydroquinate synthase